MKFLVNCVSLKSFKEDSCKNSIITTRIEQDFCQKKFKQKSKAEK